MHSRGLAVFRLSLYLAMTLVLMPVQAGLLAVRHPWSRRVPLAYHRWCRRLFGFRLTVTGHMAESHPLLFVCNHTSYLDITILGSVLPASFIAKQEVATWPLFGWLAKLQRTVFVERRRTAAKGQRDEIGRRLELGDSLILFPEGTSNDGNRTLPFKSALFAVADREVNGRPLTVQPVSIAYTTLDGMPLGRRLRPFLAWYGDMELAGHLWNFAGLGCVGVQVRFHPPITLADFPSRKAMADHCQRRIAEGVAASLSGREPPQAG